ncbi:MAG: sensor histidine kinase [Selenomonadaceae bacterium]
MSQNMFNRMRQRLTLFYSLVMAIFLTVMIFGVYKSMEWSIGSEQAREILDAANDSAAVHAVYPHAQENLPDNADQYKGSHDRTFFYVLDNEGHMLNFSRASFMVEPFVLDVINAWSMESGEVAVFSKEDHLKFKHKLMMTARPIIVEGKTAGMIYVGKDVTALYNGLQKSMLVLGAFSLLALFMAALAGHVMSGKALVPLKEAYEKQRQFAIDASHELRTPLSVVMASADVLDNDPAITSPFLKQVIGDVRDEVKKMTKLVSDLLLVARSDNQKVNLQQERLDLAEIIEQTVRRMQPLAAEKNIELTCSPLTEVDIKADGQKIKQLLLILVDNAVKYTPAGGKVMLALDVKSEKSKVKIKVSDTGIGIAPEEQDLIFDRFYRADKARSRESGGNGLGLAIAREIVRLHKGKIQVDSKPGEGTTCTVELKR